MATPIVDPHLELLPGWTKQPGGPKTGIDPEPPQLYGYTQGADSISHFCSNQPQANYYSGWLSACKRPVMANTGKLRLAWEVTADAATVLYAEALENDINLTPTEHGPTFMAGTQVIYAAGLNQGHLQLWKGNAWVDTGLIVGLLEPWVRSQIAIDIAFAGDSYTFVGYTKDGVEYDLPAEFADIPGQMLDWDAVAQCYIQQDLGPAGGAISTQSRNIQFVWQ